MNLAAFKCSITFCTREAQKLFYGRHRPGRVPEGTPGGVPYCKAHYEQIRLGEDPRPVTKPRGRNVPSPAERAYAAGVLDAADVARHHGHSELSELLRKLVAASGRLKGKADDQT